MDQLTHPPTPEQAHILERAQSSTANLMITSYAGTGKTTTLEMIERAVDKRPILYLVFNTRNAKSAEKRMLSTTTVRTFNGFGHRIWAKAVAKNLALDPKKSQTLLREIINEVRKADQGPLWDCFWDVINGVGLAKSLGYIPSGHAKSGKSLISQTDFHKRLEELPDDLTSDLIDTVLNKSIAQAYQGAIDFNDQLYMPALFGGAYPQFPVVLVDEYQDLNPVNHRMIEQMARSRIIGVGDDAQSIYAFRGAKVGGMAQAVSKHSMEQAELSVSFRCPEAIVKHAQWRVPNFKWLKSGGTVECPIALDPNDIPEDGTILCRNNAPLFGVALRLLAIGRSVSVAGSDIGPKLVAIMRKLGPESLSRDSLLSAINDWLAEKLERESTTATDMAECMKVFARVSANLAQAIAYAEHVFKSSGSIQLMTGHKAKGLEWDTVIHLDPHLCRDDEQDRNLRYVITTRSKNRLIEIPSTGIQWPK